MYLNSLSGIYTTPTLFILQYFSVRTKDFSSEIWYNSIGGDGVYSFVLYVTTSGRINDGTPSGNHGLKPVINIRSDVTVSGLGTMQNPYTFSGF